MNLKDCIRSMGIDEFARIVEVSPYTARSWMYGVRTPRTALSKRIVERTPVTWAGIHGNEPVAVPATSDAA